MPDLPAVTGWEALIISIGTAATTVAGIFGLQTKTQKGVRTNHDNSRTEIRALQDRCKDLENEVKGLKEKNKELAQDMRDAEHRQSEMSKVLFSKMDTMNETLVAIRVALGIKDVTDAKGKVR